MRKHIREIMRREAVKNGFKPSKAVHTLWERLQVKRLTFKIGGKTVVDGREIRKLNVCHGTHPKRVWRYREAMLR